jgi:hypothetical protein
MLEPKDSAFSSRLNPTLKRRVESIAGIRRPAPLEMRELQQLALELNPRPTLVPPDPDWRPYPDAA